MADLINLRMFGDRLQGKNDIFLSSEIFNLGRIEGT
jgi:hypothetical protein